MLHARLHVAFRVDLRAVHDVVSSVLASAPIDVDFINVEHTALRRCNVSLRVASCVNFVVVFNWGK